MPPELPPVRTHIALNVGDLGRSVGFYRALFGVEPDKLERGYARFLLAEPPLVLSLNAARKVKRGSQVAHLGIRVRTAEELEGVRQRVLATGHRIREQKQTLCCFALQTKLWDEDPDGNLWEVYVVLDDSPGSRSDVSAEAPKPKRCCPAGDLAPDAAAATNPVS